MNDQTKGFKDNSGTWIPYKDYTSTSAILMQSSSSEPTSVFEMMKKPVSYSEVLIIVEEAS